MLSEMIYRQCIHGSTQAPYIVSLNAALSSLPPMSQVYPTLFTKGCHHGVVSLRFRDIINVEDGVCGPFWVPSKDAFKGRETRQTWMTPLHGLKFSAGCEKGIDALKAVSLCIASFEAQCRRR
jgi:hypothetical protein